MGSLTPRNRLIVQQRAAGRTVQSIAAEHGLSPARVSQICRDHRLEVRVAELERELERLRADRDEWQQVASERAHDMRLAGVAVRHFHSDPLRIKPGLRELGLVLLR
jgi:hypothetical protein